MCIRGLPRFLHFFVCDLPGYHLGTLAGLGTGGRGQSRHATLLLSPLVGPRWGTGPAPSVHRPCCPAARQRGFFVGTARWHDQQYFTTWAPPSLPSLRRCAALTCPPRSYACAGTSSKRCAPQSTQLCSSSYPPVPRSRVPSPAWSAQAFRSRCSERSLFLFVLK